MLYCEKCKVHIRTNHSRCPLCHGTLQGDQKDTKELFPKLPKVVSKYTLVHQVVAFSAIVVSIVSMGLNWLLTPNYLWSLFVVAAVLCTFIVINVGIIKRRNLMKNTLWQLVIIEIIMLLWDLAIGWEGWSVNYFLPFGIMLALATLLLLTIFQKLSSPEYMIYFLMVCMFGCIPIILLVLHVVTVKAPSILCGGVCLILFAGLFVFQKDSVINEVSKKFHI